jgi:ribulose-phosphate 3-epimerase
MDFSRRGGKKYKLIWWRTATMLHPRRMKKKKIRIAPSILSADFARLGEEVAAVSEAGADFIHVDVMDGHFVPNLTIGPAVVKALRPHTTLPLDVHLMVSCLDLIPEFAAAGADIITIHSEASPHLDRALAQIKSLGKKAGVSLCPATHESALEYVMGQVDLILVMTVNPGFGGQSFLPSQLRKIQSIRSMITAKKRDILLEVDGGINVETSKQVIAAGADVLVAGSAVFKGRAKDYAKHIASLRI